MKKKEIIKLLGLYFFTSFFIFLLSYLAQSILSYKPSFPYWLELVDYNLPQFLYSFANFDGVHYLTIAEKGYLGTGLIQAFFPVFPLLVRIINPIFDNFLVTGLVLTQLFSLTSIFSFYYLVKEESNQKIANLAVIVFSFFLSSFYLKAFYNEGLFLTLILTTLIAAKKNKNWLAGILGALATATRIVGIFIWPALIILDWQKNKKINLKNVLLLSISALGLLGYMYYLKIEFNDPLYFFHLQEQFGASRQSSLVPFPQVVWRYLKILWTVRPINLKYYTYLQEFLVSLWALYILIIASIKNYKKEIKMEWAYLLFAFGAYFLPSLTGNFSSMPRYIIVCFPIFIYLAKIWHKNNKNWPMILYLTINLALLIINTVLFIQGYWVA